MKPYDQARVRGFTLIEMMITVAIVAILTTVALPTYNNYLARVNRSAAEQFMLDTANRQEQFILDQHTYAAFSCTATCTGSLGINPDASVASHYTFASAVTGNDCIGSAVSGPSFVITATAIGTQIPDGNLCIDSRNNRFPQGKWER
jgi:type IV pilus assembly protein PilE